MSFARYSPPSTPGATWPSFLISRGFGLASGWRSKYSVHIDFRSGSHDSGGISSGSYFGSGSNPNARVNRSTSSSWLGLSIRLPCGPNVSSDIRAGLRCARIVLFAREIASDSRTGMPSGRGFWSPRGSNPTRSPEAVRRARWAANRETVVLGGRASSRPSSGLPLLSLRAVETPTQRDFHFAAQAQVAILDGLEFLDSAD